VYPSFDNRMAAIEWLAENGFGRPVSMIEIMRLGFDP
jgi:hypothetical protein